MTGSISKEIHVLDGQVAVITGGGRGLGRAFAQAIATSGAKVAITARTMSELDETTRLIDQLGGTALAFNADVTDVSTMSSVIRDVEQRLGAIDILVNNAAVLNPLGYDWEVNAEEWWRAFEINVRGPYLCTQIVLPSMMLRRRGRIINISSIAAHTVHPYASAYCASKAALTNLTNQLAAAVKEYGITVFALSPSGPSAMKELLAISPKLPEEFRMAVREGLKSNTDLLESVTMLMFLLSGQVDKLSGRHISHWDSADKLLRDIDEIVQQDLYTLRLRT